MLVYSHDNSSVGSQALKENFNAKRITIIARKDNNIAEGNQGVASYPSGVEIRTDDCKKIRLFKLSYFSKQFFLCLPFLLPPSRFTVTRLLLHQIMRTAPFQKKVTVPRSHGQ